MTCAPSACGDHRCGLQLRRAGDWLLLTVGSAEGFGCGWGCSEEGRGRDGWLIPSREGASSATVCLRRGGGEPLGHFPDKNMTTLTHRYSTARRGGACRDASHLSAGSKRGHRAPFPPPPGASTSLHILPRGTFCLFPLHFPCCTSTEVGSQGCHLNTFSSALLYRPF